MRFILETGLVLFSCVVLWQGICLPAMGVAKGDSREMMSIPSQQIAWYIHNYSDTIDAEGWRILSAVYRDPAQMAEDYNPVRADATKAHWRDKTTSKGRAAFFHYYIRLFLKHPGNFLQSFCANIYPMLCVDSTTMGNESLLFYRDNVPATNGGADWEQIYAAWSQNMASKEDVHHIMVSSYKCLTLKNLSEVSDVIYNKVSGAAGFLFSKVLFVTWIPLLVLFYGFHRRSWNILIAQSPVFWNVMTLVAGPILLPRYMVASVYIAPLLLCLPELQFLQKKHD